MKYVEFMFDKIFNFYTFLMLFAAAVIFSMVHIVNKENEARDKLRAQTAACYSLGMVLVESDAGRGCVSPQNLVGV